MHSDLSNGRAGIIFRRGIVVGARHGTASSVNEPQCPSRVKELNRSRGNLCRRVARARRETADRHVLGHASAQRADTFVSHGSAPVLSEVLKPQTSAQDKPIPLPRRPPHKTFTSYPLPACPGALWLWLIREVPTTSAARPVLPQQETFPVG